MRQIFASVPMRVKAGGQVMRIKSDAMRLARHRGLIDDARELSDQPQDRAFALIVEQSQIGGDERLWR